MTEPHNLPDVVMPADLGEDSSIGAHILNLLEQAVFLLRQNPDGDCDDAAVWRIADAGLMLRDVMKGEWSDVQGLDIPTERGALIPSRVWLR